MAETGRQLTNEVSPHSLAEALYEAMRAQPRTFVQGKPSDGATNIDGSFDLIKLCREALAKM